MNQKKARMLRKEAKYRVQEKRKLSNEDIYRDYIVETDYKIPIMDIRDGKHELMGFKDGHTEAAITECVYGPFNEYKMLKKLYYDPNYNAELTILPSREEEQKLADEMLAQQREDTHEINNSSEHDNRNHKESVSSTSEGRLQSENGGIDSEGN